MRTVLKPWQSICMPDGTQVCLASRPGQYSELSLFEQNHNIFRLDNAGNVIWQVCRDEAERLEWARMREKAEADNLDDVSTRSPFVFMMQCFPDGTTNWDPKRGNGPAISDWVEG